MKQQNYSTSFILLLLVGIAVGNPYFPKSEQITFWFG